MVKIKMADKEINPSWLIQGTIVVLIGLVSFLAKYQLAFLQKQNEVHTESINKLNTSINLLKLDLSTLELGLRKDRFTSSQWEKEEEKLSDTHKELVQRIRKLELE